MGRPVENRRGGPSASRSSGRKHRNKEKAKSKHHCTLEEVERLYKGTSKPAVLLYPLRTGPLRTQYLRRPKKKAESLVVVQLRTGVNGLRDILSRLRVLGETERCWCGTKKKTTAYFLLWCLEQEPRRQELRNLFQGRPLSIQHLLRSDIVRKTYKQVIMLGRFVQFTLVRSLLYGQVAPILETW